MKEDSRPHIHTPASCQCIMSLNICRQMLLHPSLTSYKLNLNLSVYSCHCQPGQQTFITFTHLFFLSFKLTKVIFVRRLIYIHFICLPLWFVTDLVLYLFFPSLLAHNLCYSMIYNMTIYFIFLILFLFSSQNGRFGLLMT